MSEKRVCRLHGLVLMQCRCPCPDKFVEVDCTTHCPQYGQPETNALAPHKADATIQRWKMLAERQEKELANFYGLFRRVWNCEVAREVVNEIDPEDFPHGVRCGPRDPHFLWNCGWVYVAPVLTEEQAKKLGITE